MFFLGSSLPKNNYPEVFYVPRSISHCSFSFFFFFRSFDFQIPFSEFGVGDPVPVFIVIFKHISQFLFFDIIVFFFLCLKDPFPRSVWAVKATNAESGHPTEGADSEEVLLHAYNSIYLYLQFTLI